MAQVAPHLGRPADIDWALNYQRMQWSEIPWYAEQWAEWDSTLKEDFQMEWVGITEHWLRELQSWAEQGLLTPEQCARYDALMKLIAQHRPALEKLLRD